VAQDIVGSRLKDFTNVTEQTQESTRGYGQNGSAVSPSQQIGAAKKISKTYSKLANEAVVTVPGSDWQTRTVSAAPITPAPTMRTPDNSARVPKSNRPSYAALNSAVRTNSGPIKAN
jgi:hypothetical protein